MAVPMPIIPSPFPPGPTHPAQPITPDPGGSPTPGGPGVAVPGMNLADLIKYLQGTQTAPNVGPVSDDLAKAYIAYAAQTQSGALQQAVQLALQQQTNSLRQAELMGADPAGAPTDAAARWRAELQAQQAVQNQRLQQELLQLTGFNSQTGQSTVEARQAEEQARQRWAELTGNAGGGAQTLAAQAQAAEIARRNAELYGYDANGTATLERQQMQQQAQESAAERQLRLALQGGQLSQQESEFARKYLLEQEEGRRQNQAQSGYLANGQLTEEARRARAQEQLAQGTALGAIGGQMTEEARRNRAQEQEQRAQTVAGLTDNSRDVFKAANYFRAQQAGNGLMGALGLGGGVSGFTTQAQRNQGVPGTISYADIDRATGNNPTTMAAVQRPMIAAAGGTGGGFSMDGGGASTPAATAPAPAPAAWADTSADRQDREKQAAAGTQPGGPVGMGAGGNFLGRLVSPEQQAEKQKAMRAALDHPKVKKMFKQMRSHMKDVPGTQPGGPQGRVPAGRRNSFDGTLERDRRANKGLSRMRDRMEKRMMSALPGTQPGGPVDAPLWPTGAGSGQLAPEAPMQVPTTASVGAPPSQQTQAMTTNAAPFAQADVGAMDQKLASFQEYLRRFGVQGLGPQTLEAMNSTDKGIMEGAFGALGLNPEDAYQAYAQTRFANTGNALMA